MFFGDTSGTCRKKMYEKERTLKTHDQKKLDGREHVS